MSEKEYICLICKNMCETHRNARGSYSKYSCPDCGQYAIHDSFQPDSERIFSTMYYFLQHKIRNKEKIVFFVQDITKVEDDNVYYIDNKMLENLYPKTLNEKIDMVLLNLSLKIKTLGDKFTLPDINSSLLIHKELLYYKIFFADDTNSQTPLWNQMIEMVEILKELNYLKGSKNIFTFTSKCWNHISDLNHKNEVISQAFIAMWFSAEMASARESIIKAIKDSGSFPVIIDEKEHNNQIVPEIFYEIQRSSFIVADLTGHRNGVYYEAGYAQALGKEVILTCKEDAFDKKHFDVAQKNIIIWIDENDLYTRLLKRIKATVGNISNK